MIRKPLTYLSTMRLSQSVSYSTFNEKKLESLKDEITAAQKSQQWRTPMGDRPEDWNSKFKAFANDQQTSDFMTMMQQPIDLRPSAIKEWWRKRKEFVDRGMQQYVTERHEILGNDLAAAHFIVFRGGSVKFVHEKKWVKVDEDEEFTLPSKFNPKYKVEALKCDNMTLYYEGLENIRFLQELKFLSFRNVKVFDDWSLDRVSGSGFPSLNVLDISGTGITANGLSCLYRLPHLKLLIVDDLKVSTAFELSCLMLEDVCPSLKIVPANEIHDL